MQTLNQILSKFEELRAAHEQLNSFRFGHPDDWDESQSRTIVYPLMGAYLQPGLLARRTNSTKFILYFADRVHKGNSNLKEVLSDMQRAAMGIFAQLRDYFGVNSIEVLPDAPFTAFDSRFNDDDVAGFQLEITINQFYDANSCAEPSSFVSTRDAVGSVRIYDRVTFETVATREPGQDYGVFVFSGISGGSASSTYTNMIVSGGA